MQTKQLKREQNRKWNVADKQRLLPLMYDNLSKSKEQKEKFFC